MLCKSPFMIGPIPCACQRCMPCLVNRKRLWTFRLKLEASYHKQSCVATLTYNDFNLPDGGVLEKSHPQLWVKRLRKLLAPSSIRYFLAGEYGESTKRPHFHAILFGVGALVAGGLDGRSGLVKKTWKYGNVLVDDCSSEAIAYVAGYVTKKLTTEERESGSLPPEFIRMSLRPGIGAKFAGPVARVLSTDLGLSTIKATGDVPHALRIGTSVVPIGRYLRGLLREKLWGSREALRATKIAYWRQMWALRKEAENDSSRKASSYAGYLVDKNKQKVLNLEARTKIFAGKHTF